ncbi:MAG: SCO family protein [Gemmatimonadaceae bacterium]|nr:SCO family protein [Gemmatimonadaceae bacterium]
MRFDIFALVGLAGLVGCGSPGDGRVVGGGAGATSIAVPRPSFTLTDTDGKPFDFRARTAGRLTFLMFGYTRCPDVCPVQMANLVTALHQVPPGDRMGIDVIFVSVDPDRDSLPVLRKWLDSFDQSVIGLTGSRAALDSAQRAVGFAPAVVQPAAAGAPDAVEVLHAAPVIAFTADDTAHVMFPFGTRQADWERDIPALLQKGSRVQPPGGTAGVAGGGAGGIAFSRVYFVAPAGDTPAAVFLVAHNTGAQPDTIVALDAGDLGPASVHMTMTDERAGTTMMHSVGGVAILAGGTLRFAPGGYHGMVGPLRRRVVRGDRVQLVIRLARAGAVAVSAVVISYSDVDTATAAR